MLLRHRGGTGPPLVLLHGLGLTWRSWLPVMNALERHHEVFALDLPGHGDSLPLPVDVPASPASLADAVEAELGELGLASPAVAGNSLGGWVALELAIRGRVGRVVAIAPSGLEAPPERGYVIAMNELMRLRARVSAPFGERVTVPLPARTVLFGGLRSRPWRVPPADGARELASFGFSRGFQRMLWASVGRSVPTGLRRIGVPVRIVYGTADLMLGAFTAP